MKLVIIGGGPAGLMCAIESSKHGNEVTIIEKNEKIGKKLFITGKGRCNVTNNVGNQDFLENVVNNKKFLFNALNKFSTSDTISFFENNNIKLKTERGNRVFPESDKSSDIIKCFSKLIQKYKIKLELNTNVEFIKKEDEKFIIKTNKGIFSSDAVVVACGGKSYSSTGSTGDGYKIAKLFNHNIVEPKPALVPILLQNYNGSLAGLTLKNVRATINLNNKKFTQFGEMLFTHNGVSGPIILTLSSFVNRFNLENAILNIDLKPALDEQTLENRLLRDFDSYKNKKLQNYLNTLMPFSLVDYFIKSGNLNENMLVKDISKQTRKTILYKLKNLEFKIKCLDKLDFAIVTSGGVDVKEISPKNMESKLVKNLFFVGEVLDVDALTGGFNIQIALSTGFCAGEYLSSIQ